VHILIVTIHAYIIDDVWWFFSPMIWIMKMSYFLFSSFNYPFLRALYARFKWYLTATPSRSKCINGIWRQSSSHYQESWCDCCCDFCFVSKNQAAKLIHWVLRSGELQVWPVCQQIKDSCNFFFIIWVVLTRPIIMIFKCLNYMYWEEFFTFLRSRVLQVTTTIWFSWNMDSWFMTLLRHLFCFTLNSECRLSRVTLINVCCIIYQRRNINGTCPLIHSKSQCLKQLEYFI